MSNVIVIGGGAAGMMAAVFAAGNGHHVRIYEKNDRLGRKLFITGKGRCNITNASEIEEFFPAVVSNPKFLYSAFYSFTNEQVIDFFEKLGVKTKVERGNRVFPVSDHSSDVIGALQRELHRLGVQVFLCTEVKKMSVEDGEIKGVFLSDHTKKQKEEFVPADAVIVATGGVSYPSTGSTGDGFRFAKACGHKVTELFPALVPMEVKEWYAKELQGLSLRNVRIWITDGKKRLYEEFGEMLFTHYGVTGPVILSASSVIGKRLKEKELTLHIDLKPALTEEQLDRRVLREFETNHNRQFKNAVDSLFPSKLKPVMTELSEIEEEKKVNEITKEERMRFVHLIKDFQMTLTGLRSYSEAIITKGGVSVKEICPGTMESKIVKNLFFAGEVLDLDAVTGGYNLQIAWSTAYLAGINAGEKDE
ncbi:NAD(P)/FAD-dependent oxidoreductase [Mediterraneibacter sp.]|uniref:NAD(P)/FAD-dependent oxidoreductase n=1 Tax=Mediterraneibacter sp. TaxID=2316022 RepID=UPI0027B8E997|nr:NAD(P)/FAD-dependent oxidoreductase [Mediterraneibacter sp.]